MSLISLHEAHSLSTGIEVEGFVRSMEKCTDVWIDYSQEYKRVCNAKLTDGNNMIHVAFWESDISKVRTNLKIRITDAKWDDSKKVLYKTKIGEIIVLDFNPNLISEDIINIKKRKKIISFVEYQKYVQNSPGSKYLGIDKSEYMIITKAFTQIEKLSSKFRNSTVSSAIKYLHNKVTLSAEQISTILKIFNISVHCDRILRNSIPSKIKETNHTKNSHNVTTKKTDFDSTYLQTIIEKHIEVPTYTKLPAEISVNDMSSNSKFVPIMIEDIKHCGNFVMCEDSLC